MFSVPPLICASNRIGQPSVELLHGRARTGSPSRGKYRSGSQFNWALSSISAFAALKARSSCCLPVSLLFSENSRRANLPTTNSPHSSCLSSTKTLLCDCWAAPLSSHFSPDSVSNSAVAFTASAAEFTHTSKNAERNNRKNINISLSRNR